MKQFTCSFLMLISILFASFSISVQAGSYGYAANSFNTWADSVYDYSGSWLDGWKSILNQVDNKTELRNTCGAMAALIVLNHAANGQPGFTNSASEVTAAVKRLYNFVGEPLSGYMSIYDIRNIMKNRWGWTKYTKIRSSNLNYNYEGLKNDLNTNRPVITLMEGWSQFEPVSPQGKRIGVQHFIVVIYANNSGIYYIDPWDGKLKYATKSDFVNGWVGSRIAVVGKPN